MGGERGVRGLRAIRFGLALAAVLLFSIGKVAECAIDVGTGSPDVAHTTVGDAHIESAGTGPIGHRCHHDTGHQHKGADSKQYASPARMISHLTAPVGPDMAAWLAVDESALLGPQRRGPPSAGPPLSLSGRHLLLSTCVART